MQLRSALQSVEPSIVDEQEKRVAILESRGRGSLLDGLPAPRNAQHTETIVATKIGMLHGTSSVPGVRGEQRFDGNKVQAPECLLADLDLLHELEIGRFQQATDCRHGPLHNERVAGMQFQPPVGRHPFTLADDADNGYILPLSPVELIEG